MIDAEAPIPVFPDTVKVDKVEVPETDRVEVEMDPASRLEVTETEAPRPTLPLAVKVLRVELPETLNVDVPKELKIPAETTFKEPPIPTFPDVPIVAAEMDLVTDNESKIAAEETVSDCPIPTFPDTDMDEPIPTKPERYPVPKTFKL